jgi:sugar phosphate isomerase/epimerase
MSQDRHHSARKKVSARFASHKTALCGGCFVMQYRGMELSGGLHLAYCTNIHRGETWAETFANLERYTLRVRERVAQGKRYAIGLRLSDVASRELSDPKALLEFRRWLDRRDCYVFTINGFPYGRFHGTRVKEQVYLPDWRTAERVDYTNRLFDLLAQLVPPGVEGSVSTVPASFKEFIRSEEDVQAMRRRLWQCVDHVAALCERTGRRLHLGLEPEPMCYLETSEETALFFDQLREDRPGDARLTEHLGVNYDTCHLAVEFEEPADVLARFQSRGIRVSKLHFSSALKVRPDAASRQALAAFADDVYLHQVVARAEDGTLKRYADLDLALEAASAVEPATVASEWRIHFHVPLHSRPTEHFETTTDHLLGVFDALATQPGLCSHAEMETYTWEVLPPELKLRDVVEQLVGEYEWTLAQLAKRGIKNPAD